MDKAHLFDLMHGIHPKKDKVIKNNDDVIQNDDQLAIEDAIKTQVDHLLSLEDPTANQMLTKEVRRAKIEQEVRKDLDFTEYGKCISTAFDILRNEAAIYLDTNENETLQTELDTLCTKLEDLDIKELTDETKSDALTMSADSQDYILRIGIEKFRQELMDESLAILTLLSSIDENEADYCYRLGLVAQSSGKYDLALKAFKSTSHLAPDFPGAHLYAAECHLKIGRHGDAEAELKEAKRCLEIDKSEDWQNHVLLIEHLLVNKT